MTNQEDLLNRAQQVIRALRNELAAKSRSHMEAVAIVGMACRFPCGREDLDAYWQSTVDGKNSVRELPHDRWDTSAYDGAGPGKAPFRACFLRNPYAFDHEFFGISAREAMQMDPAQRLFLEVSWNALEDAGQTRRSVAGSDTAVFAGNTGVNEFLARQLSRNDDIDVYIGTGTGTDVIAGRLSYLLDLQGPCATINTACSSSLVALHLARRSLLAGECRMAIAGGVNVLGPVSTQMAARMDFLAPDGCSKPFDERADGFGRGEGCGVVVLKRLSDAVADRDRILALVHGSAMNQDGKTNGLTAPNGRSQVALLRRALKDAGIKSSQIGYVEAHGTGTPLGDPIEVDALSEVLGSASSPCALGSTKGNIGHLEGAAGIAGVIRTVLILQNGIIPPVANFRTLNSHIATENTRLFVPSGAIPWTSKAGERYAGVSSFGWSGTNAHVILGQAPKPSDQNDVHRFARDVIVPVSAENSYSLRSLAKSMAQVATAIPSADLEAFAWSAGVRRSHHAHRFAAVGGACEDISAKLLDKVSQIIQEFAASTPAITLVFAPSLARASQIIAELLGQEPVFKAAVERCTHELKEAAQAVHRSSVSLSWQADERTATFVLQFGITQLFASWNLRAANAYGYGVGTLAAGLADGSINLARAISMLTQGEIFARKEIRFQRSDELDISVAALCLTIGDSQPDLHVDRVGEAIIHVLQPGIPPRRSLLLAVAALYEAGAELDWESLSGYDRRFLPLPAYPFRHSTQAISATSPSSTEAPDEWFYKTEWVESPIVAPALQTTGTKWIILADHQGVAEQFAGLVSRTSEDAMLIPSPGSHIQGDEQETIAKALAAIRTRCIPGQPIIILHFLALDLNDIDLTYQRLASIHSDEDAGSHFDPVLNILMSLVHLCRGLAGTVESDRITLWTVTRGVHRLQPQQVSPNTAQAAVWGFSSSAALEHPHFWGGIIDLDSSAQSFDLSLLHQHCLANDGESTTTIRMGRRYGARLRQAMPPPHTCVEILPYATYLITGAFGGIGSALAQWLIDAGAMHLVLIGRQAKPSSVVREGIHDDVERWRASGVTVDYAMCDVANLAEMSALFSQVSAGGRSIRGVLHAAAEVVWKPLVDLDLVDLRTSFSAKAQGSLVLQELTCSIPLDFLALFSSAAVTIGTRYGSAYAAANSFVDALALQSVGTNTPVVSIQWGNWERRSAHRHVDQQQFERSGLLAMPPDLATNALSRLLVSTVTRNTSRSSIVVARFGSTLLELIATTKRASLLLSNVGPHKPAPRELIQPPLVARLRTFDKSERLERLSGLVREKVRQTLGWEANRIIDNNSGFFDMGFDSLRSIELKNSLANLTGLSLSSTIALTYPTISALTEFLYNRLFRGELSVDTSKTCSDIPQESETFTDAEAREALAVELDLLRGKLDV